MCQLDELYNDPEPSPAPSIARKGKDKTKQKAVPGYVRKVTKLRKKPAAYDHEFSEFKPPLEPEAGPEPAFGKEPLLLIQPKIEPGSHFEKLVEAKKVSNWRKHDFRNKPTLLIGSWNLQGQASASGNAKPSSVYGFFRDHRELDLMLLQEAGNSKKDSTLVPSGWITLTAPLIRAKDEAEKRGGEVPDNPALIHACYDTKRLHLGIIFYSDEDAGNPRCNMALVYRREAIFPELQRTDPDPLIIQPPAKPSMEQVSAKIRVDFYSKGLRPTIGLQFPDGCWIYNIHAPSTSNRFPTKVAFESLTRITHANRCVIAGDFNFTPGKLSCMECLAIRNRIGNFSYDLSPIPTQKSGGTLDFAMGNMPVLQVGLNLLSKARDKKTAIDAIMNYWDRLKSTAGEELLQDLADQMVFLGECFTSLDEKIPGYEARCIQLFEEVESLSSPLLDSRLKAMKNFNQHYVESSKGQGSDHCPQFFVISTETQPISMEEEDSPLNQVLEHCLMRPEKDFATQVNESWVMKPEKNYQ